MKYIILILTFSITIFFGCKKKENANKLITSKELSGYWTDTAFNRFMLNASNPGMSDSLLNASIDEYKFHFKENYELDWVVLGIRIPFGRYTINSDSVKIYNEPQINIVANIFIVNSTITLMTGNGGVYGQLKYRKD